MSPGGEEIRLRRAFTAVSPADRPRADCPPAERIWDAVHDLLAPAELRQTLGHVAGCPLCTEAWRLAEQLESSAEEDQEDDAPVRRPAAWRSRLPGPLAGIAASILLVVGLELRHDDGVRVADMRSSAGQTIELLSTGPLPRDDFLLRWRGPDGAVSYDLRVTPAADPLTPVAEASELETPEFRIPAEDLAALPLGTELLVRLEAEGPGGARLDARTFPVDIR